jgi:hypothetical protein
MKPNSMSKELWLWTPSWIPVLISWIAGTLVTKGLWWLWQDLLPTGKWPKTVRCWWVFSKRYRTRTGEVSRYLRLSSKVKGEITLCKDRKPKAKRHWLRTFALCVDCLVLDPGSSSSGCVLLGKLLNLSQVYIYIYNFSLQVAIIEPI